MHFYLNIWHFREKLLEQSEHIYKKICKYEEKNLTNTGGYEKLKQYYNKILEIIVKLEELELFEETPF